MSTAIDRVRGFLDGFNQNYGLLLLILVASFVVTAVDGSPAVRLAAALLNLAALAVATAIADLRPGSGAVTAVIFLGVAGAALVAISDGDGLLMSIGAVSHATLLAMITTAVLKQVTTAERVTTQTILGAITAYFLIGQVFAWIYLALPGMTGEPVLDQEAVGKVPVYYSYVVLTTLGFGDITPNGAVAERVTVLEALLGQVFLVVLIARLVSTYERES